MANVKFVGWKTSSDKILLFVSSVTSQDSSSKRKKWMIKNLRNLLESKAALLCVTNVEMMCNMRFKGLLAKSALTIGR